MTFHVLALTFPSLGWVVPFLLGVLLAIVVAWGWSTLLSLIWAAGADHQKRLAFTVPPVPAPAAARLSLAAAPDDAVFLKALDRLARLLDPRAAPSSLRPIA